MKSKANRNRQPLAPARKNMPDAASAPSPAAQGASRRRFLNRLLGTGGAALALSPSRSRGATDGRSAARSVCDFGAAGDGAKLDTQALQAVIDACALAFAPSIRPAADLANMKLTIEKDRFNFEADEPAEGTFKVDPSTTPGKLDAVTSDGQPVPGIFEVGDGTFTLCYSIQGGPRPKEFKAEAYSDQVLVVFRKATP